MSIFFELLGGRGQLARHPTWQVALPPPLGVRRAFELMHQAFDEALAGRPELLAQGRGERQPALIELQPDLLPHEPVALDLIAPAGELVFALLVGQRRRLDRARASFVQGVEAVDELPRVLTRPPDRAVAAPGERLDRRAQRPGAVPELGDDDVCGARAGDLGDHRSHVVAVRRCDGVPARRHQSDADDVAAENLALQEVVLGQAHRDRRADDEQRRIAHVERALYELPGGCLVDRRRLDELGIQLAEPRMIEVTPHAGKLSRRCRILDGRPVSDPQRMALGAPVPPPQLQVRIPHHDSDRRHRPARRAGGQHAQPEQRVDERRLAPIRPTDHGEPEARQQAAAVDRRELLGDGLDP